MKKAHLYPNIIGASLRLRARAGSRKIATVSPREAVKLLIVLVAICTPLAVIYGVWAPVLDAYAIREPQMTDELVTRSRSYPDAAVFDAMAARDIGEPAPYLDKGQITRIADDLLRGDVDVPGYPKRRLRIPFDNHAVFEGNSHWQLAYASFLIPRIFLEAFQESKRDAFFMAGLDFVFAWADFERTDWNLESFIWNDHAIAARAEVIASYWYHYKDHSSFNVERGGKLLNLAARTTDLLARDINYTFKTNHGMMQSVAILKMAGFFPKVESIQKSKSIALNNLLEQFRYFINKEGVVLEHSAGYHAFGLNLVAAALRRAESLGVEFPDDWPEKHQRGLKFLAALRRPDGSMPKLGDTNETVRSMVQSYLPEREFTFAPGAGYTIWWSGLARWPQDRELTQTAITWSFFPFMGHKHADELSFTLWKGGQEWWTNVGYWPYTDHRRARAVSWSGSNAPHLVGEPWNSVRQSIVLAWLNTERLKALDLMRRRTDGFRVRRQILRLDDSVWITIDSFQDTVQRYGRIVWGLHPSLRSEDLGTSRVFRVAGEKTDLEMDVSFTGSHGIQVRKVRGFDNPVAGWMANGQTIVPADAFIIDQDTQNGWVATVSHIGVRAANSRNGGAVDVQWFGPEQWGAKITHRGTVLKVHRSADVLSVTDTSSGYSTASSRMESVSENEQSQVEIKDAYVKAEKKHGKRFLPLISYRKKVTIALAVLFFINMWAIIICFTFFRRKTVQITIVSICSFAFIYGWLVNHYFIVS